MMRIKRLPTVTRSASNMNNGITIDRDGAPDRDDDDV